MNRIAPSLVLLAAGCAKSIDPGGGADTGQHSEVSSGEAVIDATSDTEWVYLDLESARIVEPATPEDSPDWDMGFRRYKVKINGGISGTGGMEIYPFFGADYNDPLEVPDADDPGWVTDEPDADGDGDPEYAFDTWFDYDSSSHRVTAADVVYIVRTVEGNHFKLQFLGYYDDAGTSGYIHLRWGPLDDTVVDDTGGDTGGGSDETVCTKDASKLAFELGKDGVIVGRADTSSEEEWVCWEMATPALVQADWDLAMLEWTFLTSAEVARLDGADFDALSEAPADGYEADDGTGSVFVDWYDYDPNEHILLPADAVYVVHTQSDRYYKLQFLSYYPEGDDNHEQPHHPSFRFAEIAPPGGGAR